MEIRADHCPTCHDVREFVQPPCVDGHTEDGGDCPEWICTDCGTALLSGVFPRRTAPERSRRAA